MNIDLNIKALSVITAGLRLLIDKWTLAKAQSTDDDEVADITNDLLFAESLLDDLKARMSTKPNR